VESDDLEDEEFPVNVVGLVDPDDGPGAQGVLCEAVQHGQTDQLPLTEIEATVNLHNRQVIGDYSYWFYNWRDVSSIDTVEEQAAGSPVPPLTALNLLVTVATTC